MAPKPKNTATEVAADTAMRTDVNGNETGAAESNDGITPPPYDAKWIDVPGAAKLAGVTSQTVRNAYRDHDAFNPVVDGTVKPAWFTTKMIDQFGNVTGYDAVYLDHAAVQRWLEMRANQPATGMHSGAKRFIFRLTEDQVSAYNSGNYAAAFDLPDGGRVAIEKPPVGNRKAKSDAEHSNGTTPEGAPDQANLFDVDLVEA